MNAAMQFRIAPDAAALLEGLPSAIAMVDADGALCYANGPARQLATAIHGDAEAGLAQLTATVPHDTLRAADAGYDDCVKCTDVEGKPQVIVRQWRHCGSAGTFSVTLQRAGRADLAGTPHESATVVNADSSEMMRADKLATVGQLAAGMAHEINNPICYVQSNLGTFRDYVNKLFGLLELSDDLSRDATMTAAERHQALEARKLAIDFTLIVEDLPALLEESREGLDRIRHIVQGLRDFSRNDPNTAFRLLDVRRALDTTVDMVRSLGGRGLQCVTHHGLLPFIECNPTELNQVFMNILVNASQAIRADGHIDVTTRPLGKTQIQIDITDDGCGMSEATMSHIFEPFFTTKAVGKGTGLGLSISYSIVRKHGGNIVVRSAPDHGATFEITLPVKQS
ncbi:MAG TPA: ATP-binding protein [Rhodanobacteraceae bacterium]